MRLDEILTEANRARATDVFLTAGAVPCIQCDGVYSPLRMANGHRLSAELSIRLAREAMSERQWSEFEKTMEANLAYMTESAGRYRINVYYQRGTVGLVCRRVVTEIPTLRQLGLPPVLRSAALADRGIVLICGSTGCGKSTTLASLINYRNNLRTGHIVTIEDPIEFVYAHRRSIVTQREVGIDTMSFHEALKNSLRQAPQVICIGELRDSETVQFAMHASETGHLVFATLHSTNASLALERILHFYPGEFKEQILMQLALNLRAIVAQRLVVRTGGGRIAAVEILVNTPRMQDLIEKGDMAVIRTAMTSENSDGSVHFDKALYRLVKRGTISSDEALLAAESANDLTMKLRGMGITAGSSWEDLSDPWAHIRGDYDPPEGPLAAQLQKNSGGTYTNDGAPMMSRMPAPAVAGASGAAPPSQRPPAVAQARAPLPAGAPPQAAAQPRPRPAAPSPQAGQSLQGPPPGAQRPPAPMPAPSPAPPKYPPPGSKPPGMQE
ncbi:PilT/PilU family type 4a pilus ATPase [Candidatus Sumerlaeota bacterium]|nr:PilT/PilU family type 4a pilus ATPase [Candidatus Sumerlaeota bacterium]